jgi:hypothetical protein
VTYSAFRAVDLHVHTPGSADVHGSYADATPDDIVRAALDAGLDAIAITDHNTVGWVDAVRAVAAGTGLVVFPGIELSTREGHLLAIFNPDEDAQRLTDLLVRLGLDTADHGRVDVQAPLGIDEVATQVRAHGGCAIAAHICKPKGFWLYTDGNRQRRQEISTADSIDAFEVKTADEIDECAQIGELRGGVAFIRNSDSWLPGGDSHTLAGIGSQRTWIKLSTYSVRALRQAFQDPDLRIRLAETDTGTPSYSISRMNVLSDFFKDQDFPLSPDVNCLLGGTGTGKSLALELIRFCLDQQPSSTDFPAIRKEVDDRLQFALGGEGRVRLWIRKDGDEYLVERAVRAGEPADPVVSRSEAGGQVPLPGVDAAEMFRLRAFSQSEVIEYARRPVARLGLLDGLLDLTALRGYEAELMEGLATNAAQICRSREELKVAEAALESLPGIEQRISKLSTLFDAQDVATYEAWQAERIFIERLGGLAASAPTDEQPADGTAAIPEVPEEAPNADLLAEARDQLLALEERRREAREAVEAAEAAAAAAVGHAKETWEGRFQAYDTELQRRLAEAEVAEGSGLPSIRAQLTRLQARQAELLEMRRDRAEHLAPAYKSLARERDDLLSELSRVRTDIRNQRREKARELTSLMDESVKIRVVKFHETQEYVQDLKDLKRGSRLPDDFIESLGRRCHPIPMVRSVVKGEIDEVSERLPGSDDKLDRLRAHVLEDSRTLESFLSLQALNIDDGVEISFAVGEGEYRPIEALAHGQKCTAVLLIALAEGLDPLLVDQPEDALHAPWIEQFIVQRLRDIRGSRQCIFATRSPNIVVSADCEQVITLDARSDEGWVVRTGGLDSFENADLVVHHVEGGRSPFIRRVSKYGLSKASE